VAGDADTGAVLRPATPEAIDRLVRAAAAVDRELDTALVCLGVLPPLDLRPIRDVLTIEGTVVRAVANGDGHRVLEIASAEGLCALILNDGTVVDRRRHFVSA
jgi:hypothetical protein